MMPKLIALARLRTSPGMPSIGTPNISEAVCALARAVMENAAEPAVALSVPLVVEARAAANWDEAH